MSELAKKLHLLKDGTVDDITAYTTLEEVNQQGIKVKFDGIDGYIGYGTEGELSRLKYQKQGNGQVYNVLKTAKPPVPITLKAYRNDETFMQELPQFNGYVGQRLHINNKNAPTIEGFDFVCAAPNNFIVKENNIPSEIKVYYIPNTVPDRNKTNWLEAFADITGDLYLQDFANTYNATNVRKMFLRANIDSLPKLNLSNVTTMDTTFSSLNTSELILPDYDTSNVIYMTYMFMGATFTKLDITRIYTGNVRSIDGLFYKCVNLKEVIGALDLSSCTSAIGVFDTCPVKGVHFKNVPRSLDLSKSYGIEGETYIIDNYID